VAKRVWVVLQQRQDGLHRMSKEAIVAGQQLARTLEAHPEAVLLGAEIGDLATEAAGFDLATVHVAEHENLRAYTPGAYVGALAPAIEAAAVDYVIFPHTYQSVEYVPRLAQRLGAALVPEVTAFEVTDGELRCRRPLLGGKMESTVRVMGEGPALLSVQSGAFPADALQSGQAEIAALHVDGEAAAPDREILGVEEVAGNQVDLSRSEVIVAVGRGVGGEDKMAVVEELAQVLGADLGASRPVIDNGWLPRDRQIGSSGQTVAPKLYIALGISGAIQHVVGMKGAGVVVAVNKDPGAPIFAVADYGIVADLNEVVPALTAALREAKG
jgi:electron transfer flavoprotein alpha subunit